MGGKVPVPNWYNPPTPEMRAEANRINTRFGVSPLPATPVQRQTRPTTAATAAKGNRVVHFHDPDAPHVGRRSNAGGHACAMMTLSSDLSSSSRRDPYALPAGEVVTFAPHASGIRGVFTCVGCGHMCRYKQHNQGGLLLVACDQPGCRWELQAVRLPSKWTHKLVWPAIEDSSHSGFGSEVSFATVNTQPARSSVTLSSGTKAAIDIPPEILATVKGAAVGRTRSASVQLSIVEATIARQGSTTELKEQAMRLISELPADIRDGRAQRIFDLISSRSSTAVGTGASIPPQSARPIMTQVPLVSTVMSNPPPAAIKARAPGLPLPRASLSHLGLRALHHGVRATRTVAPPSEPQALPLFFTASAESVSAVPIQEDGVGSEPMAQPHHSSPSLKDHLMAESHDGDDGSTHAPEQGAVSPRSSDHHEE